MNDAYDTIIQYTPRHELLAQLAEECAELAQAALKLRRTLNPNASPTNVSQETAEDHFYEEIADVLLCMKMTTYGDIQPRASFDIAYIMTCKEDRWAERIKEAKGIE